MRLLYTLVLVLLTSMVYSQKTTLYQNVNVRAKELNHQLNKTEDSLVFKCERTIYEVVIFNDNFERVIKVRDNEAIIPISDVPVGRYVVEVLLSDKLIVITLLRNEAFDEFEATPLISDSSDLFGVKVASQKTDVEELELPKAEDLKIKSNERIDEVTLETPVQNKKTYGEESATLSTDLAVAGKKAPTLSSAVEDTKKETIVERKKPMTSSLSLFKSNEKVSKVAADTKVPNMDLAKSNRVYSTYWVVYKINNGHSTEKIQKMSNQEAVDRLIKKNEIDMKTKSGRLNELTVWTVYDPSKFVQHKRKNKKDYMHITSDSFKLEPYYKTVIHDDDI